MRFEQHWAQAPESGSVLGMRLLLAVYRIGGIWPFRLLLAPVVLCYGLFHRRARRASRNYRTRMHDCNRAFPAPRPWHCLRHFWNFADALLDKIVVWMGDLTREDVVLHGSHIIDELLATRRGALILISHLGNFEVCQALSRTRPGLRLTVLQHTANAVKFNRVLDEYTNKSRVELLQVTELGIATAMRLQQKIAAGEFVAVAADRVAIANDRAIVCNFLDHPARFPLGPFALAVALEAPVLALNCIKLDGRYHIHFEYLCRGGTVPRQQRSGRRQELAEAYVARLEHFCLLVPWQWYNFFPFWGADDAAPEPVQGGRS